MASNANATIYFESGQNLKPMSVMTDSGNHQKFTTNSQYWSKRDGYNPKIIPNGLATGGDVTAGTENDTVVVAALTCYLAGVLTSVASATKTLTRGSSGNICIINSITITSAGVITVISGTASTAFSLNRGAAGGPPWIPTGSIEIAQVKLGSVTAALVTTSEIFSVVGQHVERYDYPLWEEYPIGDAQNTSAYVKFSSQLEVIHSDDSGVSKATKKVFAEVYEPIFVEVPRSSDFKAPEQTNSVSSKQIYGGTMGSTTSSLGQGGFIAYLNDGITDALINLKNHNLLFKFYQDRNKSPHVVCQGILGIARTWVVADSAQAACTISSERQALERS